MKVSLNWLNELVDYQLSSDDLASKLSLTSIGVKQQTQDYLELDLTYNRGDLLSLRGVAYEVSAITNSPLKFLSQRVEDFVWVGQNLPKTPVEIAQPELAQIQCVARIENLKVGVSSQEVVKKLNDSGMRSVDNITDITNLIMLEFGQPLHSFDASTVKDETIIVRRAKEGEQITTLDNKLRKLTANDIVLADTQKPLDVAGVMGGKDTEIKDSTNTILLSASLFNPIMVRTTSKKLGLHSEASRRFQHGLSPMRLLQALDAAIRLYQGLGGKLTAITLTGDFSQVEKAINLSMEKVNKLLGLKLDEAVITDCLKKLSFSVNKIDSDLPAGRQGILEVHPPYFRLDINIEEDLIEEIARMYGYEKIEGAKLQDEDIPKLDQSLPNFIYTLKLKLKELGLTEVNTYSFYSSAVLEAIKSPKTDVKDYLKVANPLSSETETLRMDLWPNLLEVISKNIKKGYKDIGIFEVGKIYFRSPEGKPAEKYTLSIALMNDSDNPLEELVSIFQKLSLVNINPAKDLPAGRQETSTLFHPKRILDIQKDNLRIGGAGEVHLKLLNKLGIEKRVAVLEINIEKLV